MLPLLLLLACTRGTTGVETVEPPVDDPTVDTQDAGFGPLTAGTAALPDFPEDTDPPAPAAGR